MIRNIVAVIAGIVVMMRPQEYSVILFYSFGILLASWGAVSLFCEILKELRDISQSLFGHKRR